MALIGQRLGGLVGIGLAAIAVSGCGGAGTTRIGPASSQDTRVPAATEDQAGQIQAQDLAAVRFVDAGEDVRRQCRRTARTLGFPVVCPLVIPDLNSPTNFDCRTAGGPHDLVGTGCRAFKRWQVSSFDYVGERSEGHAVIQAAPDPVSYRTFIMGPGVDGDVRIRVGTRRQVGRWRGRDVRVLSAPGSAVDGHTIFVWQARRRMYGVGFHELGPSARKLNDHLVKNSRLVG